MDNINTFRFSVVIPVFNSEEHIKQSVGSVLNQEYKDFEIIIVNDGSTDDSGKICEDISNRYNNVRYLEKENEGQLSARSNGVKEAFGEYIVFLDADDKLKDNALEKLDMYIRQYAPDCIIFGLELVDNNNKIMAIWSDDLHFEKNKSHIYKKILFDEKYNSICRKCIKREKLLTENSYADYFKIKHGEDLLQSIEAIYRSESILFVPDTMYQYINNQNSISHDWNYKNYSPDYSLLEYINAFIEDKNLFSDEDKQTLYEHHLELIMSEILRILDFNCSSKGKIELLNRIKQTDYYCFLTAKIRTKNHLQKRYRVIYSLFCGSRYIILIGSRYIYRGVMYFANRCRRAISENR